MQAAFRLSALSLIVVLGACAGTSSEGAGTIQPNEVRDEVRSMDAEPAADFDRLEAALLGMDEIHVAFEITSRGPFVSDLRGELISRLGLGTRLWVKGSFGGRPIDHALDCENHLGTMTMRVGDKTVESPAPAAFRESVILGLSRMGLLHNIALLSARQAPERAAGGFARVASCLCFARRAADAIAFKVFFGGKFAADAELDFRPDGWPLQRRQTVYFEGGSMTAVESYQIFAAQRLPETTSEEGELRGLWYPTEARAEVRRLQTNWSADTNSP